MLGLAVSAIADEPNTNPPTSSIALRASFLFINPPSGYLLVNNSDVPKVQFLFTMYPASERANYQLILPQPYYPSPGSAVKSTGKTSIYTFYICGWKILYHG
jgi:hypothetical protein